MFTWEDFIAGWIGGVAGLVVGHPLDTVKVRQQAIGSTLWSAVKKTFAHEGPRGFFKGVLFPALMTGPSNAVFFGVYGNTMSLIQRNNETGGRVDLDDPKWKNNVFWAGSVAGVAQVMVTSPAELVKIILQVQTDNKGVWQVAHETHYKGMWDCLIKTFQKRGIRGIYRGTTAMLLRDVPTSGIYTLTYEVLKDHHYPFTHLNSYLVRHIIAGGLAGVASWAVVIPIDVVKSRMQSDNPDFPKYKNVLDCFVKSYKAEGLAVFVKGSSAVCIRAFPANAAIFVTYEYLLGLFTGNKTRGS